MSHDETVRPCIVLDSNVWIDIWVFDDPIARPIRAALEAGRFDAVISPPCVNELERVLAYRQFDRFNIDAAAALANTRRLTRSIEDVPGGADTANGAARRPLPRCADRDDQKFLELAAASAATWLVTKDKALLKLNRRFTRDFDCRIERPVAFLAAWALS